MTFITPTPYKTTGTYLAQADRRVMQTLAGGFEGVMGVGDLAVSADSPASLRVSVAAGRALVNGDSVARQGAYMIENDAALLSPYADAAHATLNRTDLLVARVYDPSPDGGGAGSDSVVLEIVKGTPAASPVLPALPPNAIPLAKLFVNAAATTVSILDMRPKLPPPAPGGEGAVLPANPVDGQTFRWVPSITGASTQAVWRMVYRASTGLWHCEGGLPVAAFDGGTTTVVTTASYTSPGPALTPLQTGKYRVTVEAMMWNATTSTANMSTTGGGMAADVPSVDARSHFAGYSGNLQFDRAMTRELDLTGNLGVVWAGKVSAGTLNATNRRLSMVPITIPPTTIT